MDNSTISYKKEDHLLLQIQLTPPIDLLDFKFSPYLSFFILLIHLLKIRC